MYKSKLYLGKFILISVGIIFLISITFFLSTKLLTKDINNSLSSDRLRTVLIIPVDAKLTEDTVRNFLTRRIPLGTTKVQSLVILEQMGVGKDGFFCYLNDISTFLKIDCSLRVDSKVTGDPYWQFTLIFDKEEHLRSVEVYIGGVPSL